MTRPLLCATGTGASMVSKALMVTGKMTLLDHVPIDHRHGHKWPHVSLDTDTAYATAFGRVTDDTAPDHCRAVSVPLQLIQQAVSIQHYSRYKIQHATPPLSAGAAQHVCRRNSYSLMK